jgi:hypothetical protein
MENITLNCTTLKVEFKSISIFLRGDNILSRFVYDPKNIKGLSKFEEKALAKYMEAVQHYVLVE